MWRRDGDGRMTMMPWRLRWCLAQTQSIPVLTTHGEVEGARSQDVDGVAADIWGSTDGARAGGSEGTDRGPMELSVVTGSRDLGTAAATSIFGGARIPEDWSDAGVTEDHGVLDGINPLQPKRRRVGAQQTACKSVAEVE
jgi:hypothetical protein